MTFLRLTALTALALVTASFMPPGWADPPPWAPAHGWRAKHHYVYYPSAQVYYAPDTRLWFWFGGDGWQAGVSLPLALRGYVRTGGIDIGLDVDRPYLRNDYVVQRYGGHRHEYWRDDDRSRHENDQGENDQGNRGRGHGRHDH